MKTILRCILAALPVAVLLLVSSCMERNEKPSTTIVTKELPFRDFSGIVSTKRISAHYVQGNEMSVKAVGPLNMMERMKVKVDHRSNLYLEVEGGDRFEVTTDGERVHVWITHPSVTRFTTMADGIILFDSLRATLAVEIKSYSTGFVKGGKCSVDRLSAVSYNESQIALNGLSANRTEAEAFNSSAINISGVAGEVETSEWNDATVTITAP